MEAGFNDLHLSGSEPRIFPGLVSRKQRRESISRNTVTEGDEHALTMLKKSTDDKSATALDSKLDEESEAQESGIDNDDAVDSN